MKNIFRILLCCVLISLWSCEKKDVSDQDEQSHGYSIWDGVSTSVPADFSDSTRTFSINSAAELAWLAKKTNETGQYAGFYGYTIQLKINIDLGGKNIAGAWDSEGKIWTPIGGSVNFRYFNGSFDGCGHTIRNLFVKTPATEEAGLFGYSKGSITNLTIESGLVENLDTLSNRYSGGICGRSDGTISNCINNAQIIAKGKLSYAGGICGKTDNIISSCTNEGHISAFSLNIPYNLDSSYYSAGTAYAGGICAYSSAAISGSANKGTATTENMISGYIGGIVALSTSSVSDCENTASLGEGLKNASIGGISANADIVTRCVNQAEILLGERIGAGVVGRCTQASNCVNRGRVSLVINKRIGYLAGVCGSASVVTGCINYGTIEGFPAINLGGVVGSATNISDCTNYGSIIIQKHYISNEFSIGGVSGSASTALRCYNRGNIKVDTIYSGKVGGVGGYCSRVVDSENSGTIWARGTDLRVGGVAGSSSLIENSVNTAALNVLTYTQVGSTHIYFGGVTGYGSVEQCLNSGALACVETTDGTGSCIYTGGIIGMGDIFASKNEGSVDVTNTKSKGYYLVGGLAGFGISAYCCKNEGVLNSESPMVGGMAGQINGKFQACISIGNSQYSGVVPISSGQDSIQDCYFSSAHACGSGQPAIIGGGQFSENSWPSASLRAWGTLDPQGVAWTCPWSTLGSWNGGTPIYPKLIIEQ